MSHCLALHPPSKIRDFHTASWIKQPPTNWKHQGFQFCFTVIPQPFVFSVFLLHETGRWIHSYRSIQSCWPHSPVTEKLVTTETVPQQEAALTSSIILLVTAFLTGAAFPHLRQQLQHFTSSSCSAIPLLGESQPAQLTSLCTAAALEGSPAPPAKSTGSCQLWEGAEAHTWRGKVSLHTHTWRGKV